MGTLAGHQTAVLSLASIHGGRTLVSLGYEQSIKFWDTQNWQEMATRSLEGSPIRGMAFSPDEALVAIARESVVQLWSVEGWALQSELQVGTKAVNGMAFSPDGRTLVAGAADGKIRVWTI